MRRCLTDRSLMKRFDVPAPPLHRGLTPTRADLRRVVALFGLLAGISGWTPVALGATTEFSAAERALFVESHLDAVRPPLTLRYVFRKSGTLEAPFEDSVDVRLTPQADGTCCASTARFLSGARESRQPQVEAARSNPAILYFLEREIREMERLTKGKANYFRKRIRMAVFDGATIRNTTLPYRGTPVAVREVSIAPYRDDPNRARFEQLSGKQYAFLLSDAVPGGLYGIRTRVDAAAADAPALLIEEMLIDGAGPAAPARSP